MNPRILLVDDEPLLTTALARRLRKKAYDVTTATSAHKGLALMAETPFDVVCSDEQMPVMTGSDFLRVVSREYPDTVRIILTGEASLDAAIRAINEAAIFRFLRKPCDAMTLAGVIDEGLQSRRATQQLHRRAGLEAPTPGLATAFDRAMDSLWLAAQPLICAASREVYGYEALARCGEPTIPHPGALFDAATRLGRVFELERHIRAHAASLVDGLGPETTLFVNVDPRSLGDAQLYTADAPLSNVADRVVLEITERSALSDVNDLTERVDALRALGFRIAVDDLGSGYAGLTAFTDLQPDIVKFDMALVRDVHKSDTKSRLIRSMVTVCRELGVTTVAEGVETSGELVRLVSLGCDLLQGYLVGRPARPFPSATWPATAA